MKKQQHEAKREYQLEPHQLSRHLAQLEADYDAGKAMRPELQDYLQVLKAWVKRREPFKAARILERLVSFREKPGYQYIQVSQECYDLVIQGLSANHPAQAEKWLIHMEKEWKRALTPVTPCHISL
jgi:hypothetical protein